MSVTLKFISIACLAVVMAIHIKLKVIESGASVCKKKNQDSFKLMTVVHNPQYQM